LNHRFTRLASHSALALGAAVLALAASGAQAEEKFTYMTNWYAQAEHGGFYQAVATGIYKKYGLDVTVKMGGPQVNILQIMGAGQADCVMGSSDLQMMRARDNGLPVVTVAALFQKDPQVLIAASAQQGYWAWVKSKYGLTDAQTKPYTFNIQPFLADKNMVQQGYLTSEPYAIQKAGAKANTFLLADHGYPSYATTISCMEKTVNDRAKAVADFVKASAEGWKSYLADPAPGNALIKKDNPNMTDDQLAYSVAKMKEMGIVGSGDALKSGIGTMTEARIKANYDFLVGQKFIDPAKVDLAKAYKLDLARNAKVLP